jgi:hypothetical protein
VTQHPLPPLALDSFEDELLARLRAEVIQRPRPVAAPDMPTHGARRQARRPVLAAAGTAAVALAAAGTLLLNTSTPAYALSASDNGDVTVSITRFDDAAGLQAALAGHGIAARIDYLPDGQVCAPGGYTEAPWHGALAVGQGMMPGATHHAMVITVPKAGWQPDYTLVLSYSGTIERSYGSAGVAQGPVGACQPVPFPQRPGMPAPQDVQPGQPAQSHTVAS